MCGVIVTYNCGHTSRKKVHCDRSRHKGGVGNLLKYILLEEPCTYDTPKRRHRLCNACESQLDDLRDYETSRDLQRDEDHRERSRDDRDSSRDRSNSHREHRHRSHRDRRSGKHSSKSSRKESHSSRSSGRRSKKSSREESRGRSTRPRPRDPMVTIDESAPLHPEPQPHPQPPPQPVDEYPGDIAAVPPQTETKSTFRDDGWSANNDFQLFMREAKIADAEWKESGRSSPLETESPLDNLERSPRPPSSVYVPARADWKPQAVPQHSTNYPPPRPSSSIYPQPFQKASSPSRRSRMTPEEDGSPTRPSSPVYSLPSMKAFSTRRSHHAPDRKSSPPPVPAIPGKYAASRVSKASWVTDYVNDDEDDEAPEQSTLPTSEGTSPRKSVEPPPRPTFEVDPWTQDPFDRMGKKMTEEARAKLREQEASGDYGTGFQDSVEPENPAPAPAPYGGEFSWPAQPANTNQPKADEPKPMMNFTCYRDPNNPKPPPPPTRSSTGSRVFQHPREAPAPPDPVGGLALPNPGFNAHRLNRQSIDNISHVTRWSELCPPNVNSNTKSKANAGIIATHNGKPIHVVNPKIVKKSWGNAAGPSAGKVSQRNSSGKGSSSNVKNWFSRLRADPSEASFGCVDIKKHDSLNSQTRPDSKQSKKSSNSKRKKKS